MHSSLKWVSNLSPQTLSTDSANPTTLFECLGSGEVQEIQIEFDNFYFVLEFILDGVSAYTINAQNFKEFDTSDLSMKLIDLVTKIKFHEKFTRGCFFKDSFVVKAYSTSTTDCLRSAMKLGIEEHV